MPEFDAALLGDILTRPAQEYRIAEVLPADSSMLVAALRKTGKTTLLLNLAYHLLVGGHFLGRFRVRPVSGCVGFLNYEVAGEQLARWADEVGIAHDRFLQVNLRGARNPLRDPEDRQRLAERLRAHEVESLIVDPLARAYTGADQDGAGGVGAWLNELTLFARSEAGVVDLILSVHSGWSGERSRGSSALEDWPDSIIYLTKDDHDNRYLKAFGRDVDVEEDRLEFDRQTRWMTLTGCGGRTQSQKESKAEGLRWAARVAVTSRPGMSQRESDWASLHKSAVMSPWLTPTC